MATPPPCELAPKRPSSIFPCLVPITKQPNARYVLETAGQAEGAVGWNGPSVSVAHGADRATRTSVHQCISRCLPFLKAMTDDGRGRGGEQCIRIFRKPSRAEQNNSKKRKRNALGGGERDVDVWYTAFYIKKVCFPSPLVLNVGEIFSFCRRAY